MEDSANSRSDRVDELLDQWEWAQKKGRRLSPEELCADDPEHIETVRQHIRSLESLTKYIDDRSVSSTELPLPEFVGSFRVQKRLSEGGMGLVYLCLQENPRREVAVKTIPPTKVTSESIERFRLEAHVLGLLRHPGIAQIYEAGEADLGSGEQPYIVLELVSGEPIDKYVESRRCDVDERIRLVSLICDAVAHAHANGVVHRDLKPANVLVQDDGQPKILDFGIARLIDSAVKKSIAQHETVGLLGSLAYMSPEQVAGDVVVDDKTDVYSLGVLLYQLLSGQLPFEASPRVKLGSLIRNITERSPTPLGVLNKRFRGDLETIVSRAMAKDTTTRYQSVMDLGAELRRFLNGQPIAARPIPNLERAWRWCSRHRSVSALVFAALVIAVVGISAATYSAFVVSEASEETHSALESEKESLRLAEYRQELLLREAFGATLLHVQQLGESNPGAALEILDDPTRCPPERRSFAWRLLRKQFDRECASMKAHGRLHTLSYSPDGKLLVGLGDNGQLRSWDADSGELIATRRGVLHRPTGVAFFGNSTRLVSADHSHAILVWDSSSWERILSFTGHQDPILALSISPDDGIVASADKKGNLKLWSPESGKLLHSLRSSKPIVSLGFVPDGSLLAFSLKPSLEEWDISTGSRKTLVPLEVKATARYAAFSFDGRLVAATERATSNVFVWDTATGNRIAQLRLAGRSNSAPVFSPDGTFLSCSSRSRNVEVWSTRTWKRELIFEHGIDRHVLGLAFSPNGKTLVSSGGDKFIRQWDFQSSRRVRILLTHGFAVQDMDRVRGSKRLAAVATDGSCWIIDREFGLTKIVVEGSSVQRCSSSPTGHFLAIQDGTRQVAVFRTKDAERIATSPRFDSDLRSLCFLNDDDGVAVTTVNGPPSFWKFSSKQATPLWGRSDKEGVLQCHPATDLLVLGTNSGKLVVGSTISEKPTEELSSYETTVTTIQFSRDGKRLAAGFADGSIVVWNWAEREVTATMTGLHETVYSLDFTADSTSLVSSGKDGTTRIWDSRSGQLQATLSEPFNDVRCLLLAQEDDVLFLGTRDGRLLAVETD